MGMANDYNPLWDLIVTYDGVEYPLDFNALTKREEILIAKRTGLTLAEFLDGFYSDDAEANLFGVWLAMHRKLGDGAPKFDTVDIPRFGEWSRVRDVEAAEQFLKGLAEPEDPTTRQEEDGAPETS